MNHKEWLGLTSSHLTPIGSEHALAHAVVAPFSNMQSAAQQDGIDLQLFSSFRSFEKQSSIWARKWDGHLPILSADNQPLDPHTLSDIDKMHSILRWSALPGASRHHWGTDFDVYDKTAVEAWPKPFELTDSEYAQGGPCGALSSWLDERAHEFGFYRPYATYCGGIGAEPWHLSHRQSAEAIEKMFDPAELKQLIEESHLPGKPCILAHFDEIFFRYVQNKGIPVL
ncbi:M15 family metallopeptidase [Alteromonas oceanisediminis]|uniref:M15 family metallopeptidase n=1 Tax=Alteromonas oceanisediminis TaxID=2836180 RepID=UPI001BDA5F22|nr:M15 family metallopeptidase [Alteromonas oceanisediminis]MBT0587298.1 M15 family metallopeptidase [Alteromonas oceanisediminis]